MPEIKVTPLGAGQDVGRSCILVSIGGKNIMLDCGMHMGFNDDVSGQTSSFPGLYGTSEMTLIHLCLFSTETVPRFFVRDPERPPDGLFGLCDHQPFPSGPLRRSALHERDGGLRRPHLHDPPHQGHLPHPAGGLQEDHRRQEGRNQLLHLPDDQRLHEESGSSEPPPNRAEAAGRRRRSAWLLLPAGGRRAGDQGLLRRSRPGSRHGAHQSGLGVGGLHGECELAPARRSSSSSIRVDGELSQQGDYNMTPDRHLGAAWIDKCRPDILISESTYATTIRDSKRCRERDFLKKVHETIERGGKVLIPVFALGRAQELCILLETFWERMNLKAPIYFSTGLTEKANHYYKLFITWTNQKIRKTFVQRNMFEFKHIKAFDRSYADNPGPMVVFATPGMLHAGQSLQIFKKWAGNEKNMVQFLRRECGRQQKHAALLSWSSMPGYCVQGTIGHKILNGQRKLEMEGRATLDVKLQVEYMSFSAHADAKGIMQLIRMAEPRNMLLVHGEAAKMEFLKGKIEQEFSESRAAPRRAATGPDSPANPAFPPGIDCYMPANGETATVSTNPSVPVDISLNLLKREMALGGPLPDPKKPRAMHGTLIMKENSLRLVPPEQALKELGLNEHQLRFTCRVHLQDPHSDNDTLQRVYTHLRSVLKGYTVQHLPDGTVMVESIVVKVSSSSEDASMKVLLLSWSYQVKHRCA
ncbi:unnamed protein product [Tetraodon nigroviridis]|uniref:Integrator complex subunit 11 n=1 Tax=Tetraodon nigroviridis TaxID=99883 RepID=Q4S6C2_TETNG|nr:unnamed protein product [Tetraodon nigroviridis]